MTRFLSRIGSFFRNLPGRMRRHPWISAIVIIVLLIVAFITYGAMQPTPVEYVTETSVTKDVVQTVEAVGTVISERDLSLQFSTVGVVAQVYVKEGDRVRAGQRLAALQAGTRAADIASAQAQVRSAQADLQALLEGLRPEDLAILEAQVANKRALLEAARTTLKNSEDSLKLAQQKLEQLKSEAAINLSGYVTTSRSAITQQIAVAQTSLGVVEDVLNGAIVQDAIMKSAPDAANRIKQQTLTVRAGLSSAAQGSNAFSDYQGALATLRQARDATTSASAIVQSAYDTISGLVTTSYYTDSVREENKTTLSAERSRVQAALSALDSSVKTLQDASASLDTRISTEESTVSTTRGSMERAKADIQTYQTSLQIDEAQLALKRAGARKTDIESAAGRVASARASLARASASYAETVITAPIDGTITKVIAKPGEYSPSGGAITMLGQTPYRIEMFVSEIDVPKLVVTQSGSIELDSFPGVDYAIRVSEIDNASTDVDGVSKYRLKLDFVYPHDELKIGMKGDTTVITGERKQVVAVPGRAVIENEDGELIVRVLKDDGTVEERPVTIGLEGDSDTEILSGLAADETVVVLVKR